MAASATRRRNRKERQQLGAELALHGWEFIGRHYMRNVAGVAVHLRINASSYTASTFPPTKVPLQQIDLTILRAAVRFARTENENR